MDKQDWSSFTTKISIATSKEMIFDYFTIPENIELWFLSQAYFFPSEQKQRDSTSRVAAGDQYKWKWYGSDIISDGEVIELHSPDLFKFSFLGCIVSVELKYEDGELMVELTQSEIPLDDTAKMNYYVGCTRGWTFYLANLKSIIEGGIDLRNKNVNLVDVINT